MKGSVKKNSQTGKWDFVVDIGKDPLTGKRKQKKKRGFNSKKEAEEALARLINEVNEGEYIEPSKMTLKQYLREWLDFRRTKNSISTYKQLVNKTNSRIIPVLGQLILSNLNHKHIQQFHNSLFEDGLSEHYIITLHSILSRSLNDAIKLGYLKTNPATVIGKPKLNTNITYNIWTLDDCKKFLTHAENSSYFIVFLLAIYTGMRRGEILGLKWDDIDFDTKKIYLRRNLYYENKENFQLKEVKTKSSIRQIVLDDYVINHLKKHKQVTDEKKLLNKDYFRDYNLVCSCDDGTPFQPQNVGANFRKITKQIGLKPIRFHDLRHSHATNLLKLGVNPKVIQERLGHKSIQITLDIYSHVLPDMQQNSMNIFSNAMNM